MWKITMESLVMRDRANKLAVVALLLAASGSVACGGGGGKEPAAEDDAGRTPGHDAGDTPDADEEDDAGGGKVDAGGSDHDAADGEDAGGGELDAASDAGGNLDAGGDSGGDLDAGGGNLDAGSDGSSQGEGGGGGPEAGSEDAAVDGGTADADAGSPVVFTILPAQERHPISPAVYGVDSPEAAELVPATVVQLGDDEASGYNWEVNATNVADGTAQRNVALGSGTAGARAAEVISAAQDNAGLALLTLPIGQYVAADSNGDDVLQSANYLTTRFKQNSSSKGSAFSLTPDTTDAFVYQDEFVNWAMAQAGTTPVVFALDNEPGIWELVHGAFHPTKATYDDVVNLGVEYAKTVKDVWPAAEVAGPVSYGWLEYLSLQQSPDAATDGNFLAYYLSQMAAASQTDGRRLLDYLSVHWYPEVKVDEVRIVENISTPALVDARVQAPRSLWDSAYREPTWIQDSLPDGIQLVPRLKAIIGQSYPNTKLAISGWSYGGGNHISGAVAAADVLGIFGRERVDLAVADVDGSSDYVLAALRAFLDYDGQGASFGDTSVRAQTSDRVASSVYASVQSGADSKLVIIAINKTRQPLPTTLAIGSATTYTTCAVFELTAAGPAFVAGSALSATDTNSFDYSMPAMSVAVIVPAP